MTNNIDSRNICLLTAAIYEAADLSPEGPAAWADVAAAANGALGFTPPAPLSPARIDELYKLIETTYCELIVADDPEDLALYDDVLTIWSGIIKYPEYLTVVFGA